MSLFSFLRFFSSEEKTQSKEDVWANLERPISYEERLAMLECCTGEHGASALMMISPKGF